MCRGKCNSVNIYLIYSLFCERARAVAIVYNRVASQEKKKTSIACAAPSTVETKIEITSI